MKKLLSILVILISINSEAATLFSEVCLDPSGSQLNGGSDTNVLATYASTNGNWNGTSLFIPTDGSTPAASLTNKIASVYVDGSSIGVYLAYVVAVTNAANGGITLSTTAKDGAVPSSSATTRTIRIGGALRGPLLADHWPIGTIDSNLVNAASSPICINFRGGNGNYTSTNSFTNTSSGIRFNGYTNTFRDGGRANIYGLTINSAYQLFVNTGPGCVFSSLEFATNGATASAVLFLNSGANNRIVNCVFHDSRGDGYKGSSTGDAEGNEAYHNGLNNSAGVAGMEFSQVYTVRDNFVHNNNGANVNGILASAQCVLIGNIISSNGLNGVTYSSSTAPIEMLNNDIYANVGSGVDLTGTGLIQITMKNNNFFKNGAWAFTSSGSSLRIGTASHNRFGAGTMANGSGNFDSNLGGINDDGSNSSYANDTTPWNAPDTGDFTLVNASAIGTGAQTIISTMSGFSPNPMTGYPPIGALVPASATRTYSFPFAQ